MAVLRLMTSSNLVGLLHRQVGRPLALENPPGIDANLAIGVRYAGSVAHQAAGHDPLALAIASRQCIAIRQGDDLLSLGVKETAGTDEQRTSPVWD